MGMTWDEYYKNRQKKKKEEQQKAETKNKQNISSNKSIKIQQTVSPSTSLGSTFQRTIQPSDSANNTINTNAIKKNSPSLWNQIQSIVKPNDTVSKFKQLSPEDKESFERTSYTLSDAEYKAKKEADEFNRIMEKGTKKEQIEAVIDRIGKSILGGFKKPIGGLINIGTTAGADILKTAKLAANDESKEQFDKWQRDVVDYGRDINDQATEFDQSNAKINNPVVKYGTGALNTVSNVIANYVLTGGKGGTILQGLQVGGSSAQEVLNKDYNATGQAIATGAAKGYLSKKTEEMFDANILTRGLEKSSIQDVVNQTIKNKIKSGLGQKVASKTAGIVGENIEEFVEDNVGNVIDKIVNNEDMPSLKEWWNNTTETAKATTLSTVLMNMMGIGGGDINEIETDLKNQNLSKEDIEKTKKAIQVIEQENLQNQDNKVVDQETKIAQNGLSQEQILANNQEMLYNSTNESESDVNGQIQSRGMEQLSNERNDTNIQQNEEYKKGRRYTKQEYTEWESSIKPTEESNITTEQKTIKDNIKRQYNKDIVFFDGENNYNAGASLSDKNKIYVNSKQVDSFGINKVIHHEIMESNIFHNKEISNDIIQPAIEKIINDPEFENQKNLFWSEQEGNMPSDYAIAKDILCDRFSEVKTGEELDYQNVLSNETNMTIDYALETFNNKLSENSKELKNDSRITRHEVIQKNREVAKKNIENISTWKDKKSGLRYQMETMERNMYDIIPNKEEAKKMNDTYFEPIHKSEAEKQKFINKYNDRIKEFKLNKYESEAVQYLGEKKYNPSFNQGDNESITKRKAIEVRIKNNIKNGKINEAKVNEAIETFRNIYDELFEIENNTLKENGYKEKDYRKGYFPHFIDYVPETKTEKVLNALGFKVDKRPLPTDISGITEQFVPGKTWNRSTLERKTNKTDYNALKGFDTYISQAADNIFHTENIQRLRGLENEIRYQYSDKGVQERIDNILNDETLFEDEKQDLIDRIYEQVENPLPNLVTELRRYTNALANKKSEADRSIENKIGRPIYSTVNAIENRFGANAVGLNIGSAVTNFIPIMQAYSQVSTKNMGRAFIDTVKSYINNDGFADKSTFLTNRINQSEKLYKTTLEKISDKTSFLFKAIDEVTSNIVVRGKYLQNIQDGMNENEAIKNADRFAANVIADRSKGSLPTLFEEKNPATKMFTQFQLEVNNQFRYMFKDIPRDLKDKGLGAIAMAFIKMFIGAWLYNEASEKVTGRKPAFDPIDLAVSGYKDIKDDKKTTYNKITSIGKRVGEQVPFVGSYLGGGRIPINGAIPDFNNVGNSVTGLVTGEMDSKKAWSNIGKEVAKPLYYQVPPFGGAQIKKTVEGIKTVKDGGSYGVDSKGEETLQFPVENATAKDYIKAGIFGKYALPLAKDYTDNNYKNLNAKQTKLYKESKLPYKELIKYINQGFKQQEEKINYLESKDMTEQQKWGIYKYDIFSNTPRKEGGSQLEDAEYITSNGVSKTEYIKLYNKAHEKNIDMPTADEYKELKKNNIQLKNYIDYTVKVKELLQKKKQSGDLDEKQQLKTKDKCQILLYSNYTNKEKKAIYESIIGKDDKLYNNLLNKSNIDIDEYLNYKNKVSEKAFKADKDKKGKTITGSAKNKLVKYLNSNVTGAGNRLLIAGNSYALSNSERQSLSTYINKIASTKDEKIEIYKQLDKNFVVNKGKVYMKVSKK